MTSPRFEVGAAGSIFGCPARVTLGRDEDGYTVQGRIQLQGRRFAHLLEQLDSALTGAGADPVVKALVAELLGGLPLDLEVDVFRSATRTSLGLEVALARVRVMCSAKLGTVIVVRLADDAHFSSAVAQQLVDAVRTARRKLHLGNALLAYRRGSGIPLADLTGDPEAPPLPRPVLQAKAPWLAYAELDLDAARTTSSAALKALTGKATLAAYLALGAGANGWALVGALSIPSIQTPVLVAENLYVAIELGGTTPSFQFNGTIIFKPLGDVRLTLSGNFGADSFALAGEVEIQEHASFSSASGSCFQAFSLENVGVLIGYDAGLTIGVLASFTLLDQAIFGAAIITLEGDVPVPRLVSGAIEPISLPRLFRNLTRCDIAGLDALDDIIAIAALDLAGHDFPRQAKAEDVATVVAHFNSQMPASLQLVAERTRIRQRPGGYGLVDQLHMRHFFVERTTGRLSLQPQFYVAEISQQFGSFSVQPGIFLAGKITVLGKSFEVLLSLRKDSGILAYAQLDPIEIKVRTTTVLRISGSDQPTANPIHLEPHDLAGQLVPAHPRGLVFFLSASKRDVSFYFDGHLEVLEVFRFDARVVYCARNLSIHADLEWLGIHVVFQLDAEYAGFPKAGFSFSVQVDTKALLAKLVAVTHAIDEAIQSLHASMASALASLDEAQQKVDQLRRSIADLDGKIAKCQKAIHDARWWKKVFVSIAKGAEIAAFEVAKAGVWTAIGVATAALEVARLAVKAFDTLGPGLLELVNATIREASKLLFLRRAEISACLTPTGSKFSAQLELTALGKDHAFDLEFDLTTLQHGFLKFLERKLLDFLKLDLDDVKKGRPLRGVAPRALRSTSQPDDGPPIQGAAAETARAVRILRLLQTSYRAKFGEDLAELASLNAEFSAALQAARHTLGTANQALRAATFTHLHAGVQHLVDNLDAGAQPPELVAALEALKGNLGRTNAVAHAMTAVRRAHRATAKLAASRPAPPPRVKAVADHDPNTADHDARMIEFLRQLEVDLARTYGDQDTGYINLRLEPTVEDHFRDGYEHLGAAPGPVLRKGAPTTYRPRLRAPAAG